VTIISPEYRSALLDPEVARLIPGVKLPVDNQDAPRGVAWHYGDPLVEQRAPFVVDRSDRVVAKVSGSDRLSFLNNLLSQKLDDLVSSDNSDDDAWVQRREALNLDAQGRVLQHMTVWAVGDEVYVECARAGSQELFDYLQKMIFWSDVQIEITDLAIVTAVSDSPAEPLDCCVASASYPLGVASGPLVTDLLVERSALLDAASLLVEQGYRLAGLMAWEAERVMAVMPEVGVDTDTTTIPHETYAFVKDQRAVHFDKGCYRGQETVARVHFLGRSPRTLVQVYLDGSVPELPAPGTPITAGGTRSVGVLGTVVDHADFGPIGLALLKRSAVGKQLAAGECALSVETDTADLEETKGAGREAIERLRGGK